MIASTKSQKWRENFNQQPTQINQWLLSSQWRILLINCLLSFINACLISVYLLLTFVFVSEQTEPCPAPGAPSAGVRRGVGRNKLYRDTGLYTETNIQSPDILMFGVFFISALWEAGEQQRLNLDWVSWRWPHKGLSTTMRQCRNWISLFWRE